MTTSRFDLIQKEKILRIGHAAQRACAEAPWQTIEYSSIIQFGMQYARVHDGCKQGIAGGDQIACVARICRRETTAGSAVKVLDAQTGWLSERPSPGRLCRGS
jgi:hypothetical protein